METKDFGIIEKDSSCSKEVVRPFSQSFRRVYPTYQLDEKSHRLIEVGFRDVQKEIDSHKECALDVMLDKFLEREEKMNQEYEFVDSNDVVEYPTNTFDLAELGDALELAEIYRQKYGLPQSSTPQEIFSYVKEKEVEINAKIKSLQEIESEESNNA